MLKNGTPNNDILRGSSARDTLNGRAGNDQVFGLGDKDIIRGGTGSDIVSGGNGGDTLFGGEGFDWLNYADSGKAVQINLGTGAASGGHASGDSFSGFEAIIGSAFNDILTGDNMANFIHGGAGADVLDGKGGFDWLSYSDSTARVVVNLKSGAASGGHAAGDVFSGFEAIIGSAFNDKLSGDDGRNSIRGGEGADNMNGGAGVDTVSYVGSSAAVRVNLNTATATGGDATGDTLRGFEGLIGSSHDDVLRGDAGNNMIRGGAGADSMAGGLGKDDLSYMGSDAGVKVNLNKGKASGGDAAGDSFTGFEGITGSSFDDALTGNDAANQLVGREGDDVLRGLKGDDWLKGGSGSDTLIGGAGNDVFVIDSQGYTDGVVDRDITDAKGSDVIRIVDGVKNGIKVAEFKPGLYRLVGDGVDADEIQAAAGLTVVRDKNDLLLVEKRPPVITSDGGGATAAINVAENATAATNVGSTDDSDSEGSGLTYSISGGADQALFNVDAGTGALSFKSAPDFENPTDNGGNNVYDVQVTVTDSGGLTDMQDIAVTVTNVNEAPVITSDGGGATAAINVAENATAATNVGSTDDSDSEGSGLTYSISGGADQALFNVDAGTGALSFKSAPDFENPTDNGGNNVYDVQVTVTDSGGLTDMQDIAVTVTNVDELVATDDGYTVIGNVGVTVNAASGILSNDGGSPTTLKFGTTEATAGSNAANGSNSVTTSNGGTVTVNADGSFTYDNAAGFDGTDTFYYEISNANGSDVGKVDFTVGDTVWFIDNTASGSTNEGTLDNPFMSLADYNATTLEEAGDDIFLFGSATPYTGGITLLGDQKLIGQGATGTSLASLLGIIEPTGSETLPSLGGANPVIENASGEGIRMASNNTIRGVDVGDTASGSFGVNGSGVGTAVIDDVSVNGTGGGVRLTNGNISASFNEISVNDPGSVNGIYLQFISGSFSVTGDGSTATIGGNGSGGTIRGVSGNGVQLSTVENVTLQNMVIGNPASTTNDTNYTTNSVGTNGIQASSVTGLNLRNSTISETGGNGIIATASSNLIIDQTEILNAGDDLSENGIRFNAMTGTNVITNSVIDGSFGNAVQVSGSSATTSNLGILNSTIQDTRDVGAQGVYISVLDTSKLVARIEGNTFDDIMSNAVKASNSHAAELQITISGNTFQESNSGFGGPIDLANGSSNVLNATISGNGFTDDFEADHAVLLSNSGSGGAHGTITGNTVNRMGLLNFNNSTGQAYLKIDNNTVSQTNVMLPNWALKLDDRSSSLEGTDFTISNNSITITQDIISASVPVLLRTANNGQLNGQIANNTITDLGGVTTVVIDGDDIELLGMVGPVADATLLNYLTSAGNTLTPNQATVWGSDGFTGGVAVTDPSVTDTFVLI